MSPAQEKFYWRLWGMAKAADPELKNEDRKRLHAELGLPESHQAFSQRHFDAWKGHCLALAQPGNLQAQMGQQQMAATRSRWLVEHLAEALGEDGERYCAGILRRMNKEGAFGRDRALEDLSAEELQRIAAALRKQCRRVWPRKGDLLAAIGARMGADDFDAAAASAAVMRVLNVPGVPDLEMLPWDELVLVMAALRGVRSAVKAF